MNATTPTGTMAAQTPAQTPVQTAQNNDMNRSTGNTDMAAATPANNNNDTGAADRQRLPRTASPYPMVAMFGLVSLLGAAVVTVAAKR